MDYINNLSLQDLHKSLSDAQILVDAQLSATKKDYNESLTGKSNRNMETMQRMIEKLHDHVNLINNQINEIKALRKNTLYCSVLIDCRALVDALNNFGHPIDSAEMIPIWECSNDPDNDIKVPIAYQLQINYSRYAMNGNGYHVGYENVMFSVDCIKKKSIHLFGEMPYNLSSYVVNPHIFTIESSECPPEELPTINSHSSDCAIYTELPADHDWDLCPFPDECDCGINDNWNGYSPPDEDFFYAELASVIHNIIQNGNLPEAEFDNKSREWRIGNEAVWRIGETAYDDMPD